MTGPVPRRAAPQRIQMERTTLSDSRTPTQSPRIKVRASRVYHHRGGLEHGDVKEIRIVFIDAKGDSMFALMEPHLAEQASYLISEGSVYTLSQFGVSRCAKMLKPVDNPLVIIITELTTINQVLNPSPNFPRWTFRLTSLHQLPTRQTIPRTLIDVIGVIRGVTENGTIFMDDTQSFTNICKVRLDDESGNEFVITLFSDAARNFRRLVPFLSEKKTAVIIFVGLDVTFHQGYVGLAGLCACRWHLDENIPEIRALRARIGGSVRSQLQQPRPRTLRLQTPCRNFYPTRPISLLLDTDFFNYQDTIYKCIVTIDGLISTQPWWVTRCTQCKNTAIPVTSSTAQPEKYRCSNNDCTCTQAEISYHLSLLGSDITGEAIFVLQEEIAQSIIAGSPQEIIENNSVANLPLENIGAAAATLSSTPAEITAVVSWRFKLVIHVKPSCFSESWMQFNVLAIEEATPPANI